MYLHLEASLVPLGIEWNGWWVFIRRGFGWAVMSGCVVSGNLASSKNSTRWPMGFVLVFPSVKICHVISWSQVVPWIETKQKYLASESRRTKLHVSKIGRRQHHRKVLLNQSYTPKNLTLKILTWTILLPHLLPPRTLWRPREAWLQKLITVMMNLESFKTAYNGGRRESISVILSGRSFRETHHWICMHIWFCLN